MEVVDTTPAVKKDPNDTVVVKKRRRVPTKKVSRACVHCRAAHITCDESRPCKRCVKKGLQGCVDAPRKVKKYLSGLVPKSSEGSLANDSTGKPISRSPNPLLVSNGFVHTTNKTTNDRPNTLSITETNSDYTENRSLRRTPIERLKPSNSNTPADDMNFLSSAADLEYAILGNIIDSDMLHYHQFANNSQFSLNSNPSKYVSPALSTTSDDLDYMNLQPLMVSRNTPTPGSPFVKPLQPIEMNRGFSSTIFSNELECDEQTNQYFIGGRSGRIFPEVVKQISKFKKENPSKFKEQNKRSVISFSIGLNDDDLVFGPDPDQSGNGETNNAESGDTKHRPGGNKRAGRSHRCGLLYYEPSEIYSKVNRPFPYVKPYHDLNLYLKSRFSKEDLVQMSKSIAEYRPSFIAGMVKLKEDDLIFAEQCFQRTLLEYDSYIGISGTPTLVWRRTSQIAYVGDEFCVLTGWNKEELLSKSTFAVEIMDDKSCVDYFKIFSKIAFGDASGEIITECTLLTPKGEAIRTSCTWTLKRDVFGIPMMIIATFLPILT